MITHKSIGYSGRLGNQMFQYAALKALSLQNGLKCVLPNHLSIKKDGCYDFTYNKWIEYKLDLFDCFEITAPIIDFQFEHVYQELGFSYDSNILNVMDNMAIEGWFQSYKYFDTYKDIIVKEFTFKENILSKCKSFISQYKNPVAIHIRRGDQVGLPTIWNVTPEYIAEAWQNFTDDEYTFLIFSDDIEWCKQIFPEGVVFVEGNNQFEDMCLMSLCKHNVITNSSFSWWAAYLNKNENKRVITPSNWFIPAKPLDDLFPKNWITI